MAAGASAADAKDGGEGQNAPPFSFISDAFAGWFGGDAPEITPPLPRAKPEQEEESEVVARCGPVSLVAGLDSDGETPVYTARFDPAMEDDLAAAGCERFYKGCNVCTIRYTGCSDAERAACTGAACLEEKCERRVRCSVKSCKVRGDTPPTCKARMARSHCLKKRFE